MKTLKCDMDHGCTAPVTHIGEKGWVYCAEHAPCRSGWERCRRLRAFELRLLERGKALPSYAPLSKAETLRRLDDHEERQRDAQRRYEDRVRALELEGLTTSDAQAVIDAEERVA